MARIDRRRRQIITFLLLAPLLWLLDRFLRPNMVAAGKIMSVQKGRVPVNGALVFREKRIAIINDGNDYFALDLTCTHLGCTVSVTAEGLSCPCHGSRFDRHGKVVTGPATRPLRRVRMDAVGDELKVLIG